MPSRTASMHGSMLGVRRVHPRLRRRLPHRRRRERWRKLREKQAKERAEQSDLFDENEDEDRFGTKVEKTPVKNKEELKTAAEKAVERVTQKPVSQPTAEAEAEEIATAVETKAEPVKAEATESDDDPFGLNDLL